jgi:hypothetical protein
MRIRKAVVPGSLMAAVAFTAACSDVAPTEPLGFEQEVSLFGDAAPSASSSDGFGIDGAFVRIAREHPGFGGLFYGEDGALNIVSAGVQPMSLRALGPSLSAIGIDLAAQPVNMIEGQYDFVQLNSMHQSMSAVLQLRGVVSTDADEARNRVVVGVEDAAAAAAVERAAAMLGLPAGAVIVERTNPVYPDQSLRDRVRPVVGGLQINFPGFLCTHGFNVRGAQHPDVQGFVTNSHCSAVRGEATGTPYWQPSSGVADSFIGNEEHDLAPFTGGICPAGRVCRYSDALGARYAEGVDIGFGGIARTLFPGTGLNPGSLNIDPANPRWEIVDEIAFPTVGQVLHKTGRTNGWTMGPVNFTCQNVNVGGSNYTLFCQDRVTTWSSGGDSGSPYFFRFGETNTVALIGIHWGSDGAGNTVMSAMQNIRCENQGPAPWITFPGQTPPAPTACPGR